MKILIAPDSFKGSVSSIQAARVMKRACREVFPSAGTTLFPLADGGEGTIAVFKSLVGGRSVFEEISDPLCRKISGQWLRKGAAAYIEMAQAAGLTLIEERARNPLKTTTFGVGELISRAVASGCRKIFIGVGGSATNDGGIGALTALGVRFSRKDGSRIYPGRGGDLTAVGKADLSGMSPELARCAFTILADVENPLYGPKGAAYVYGPQKGAKTPDVKLLDRGLRNYSRIVQKATGRDMANLPGAGAAGGLAGGLAAFLQAEIVSGIEAVLEKGRFGDVLKGTDLLLTGEGSVDLQSGYGKSLGMVVRLCEERRIPVVIMAGNVAEAMYKREVFRNAVLTSIVPGIVSLERSLSRAGEYLYCQTVQMLKLYRIAVERGVRSGKDGGSSA